MKSPYLRPFCEANFTGCVFFEEWFRDPVAEVSAVLER
jgi:hypothetical protein